MCIFCLLALHLTVCVAFVAALRASNYLPLRTPGREINPAKCASAAMKATQCYGLAFFLLYRKSTWLSRGEVNALFSTILVLKLESDDSAKPNLVTFQIRDFSAVKFFSDIQHVNSTFSVRNSPRRFRLVLQSMIFCSLRFYR